MRLSSVLNGEEISALAGVVDRVDFSDLTCEPKTSFNAVVSNLVINLLYQNLHQTRDVRKYLCNADNGTYTSSSSLGGNLISSISVFIRRNIIFPSNAEAESMNFVLYVPFVRSNARLNASAVCAAKTSGYKTWKSAHNSCSELDG